MGQSLGVHASMRPLTSIIRGFQGFGGSRRNTLYNNS